MIDNSAGSRIDFDVSPCHGILNLYAVLNRSRPRSLASVFGHLCTRLSHCLSTRPNERRYALALTLVSDLTPLPIGQYATNSRCIYYLAIWRALQEFPASRDCNRLTSTTGDRPPPWRSVYNNPLMCHVILLIERSTVRERMPCTRYGRRYHSLWLSTAAASELWDACLPLSWPQAD